MQQVIKKLQVLTASLEKSRQTSKVTLIKNFYKIADGVDFYERIIFSISFCAVAKEVFVSLLNLIW